MIPTTTLADGPSRRVAESEGAELELTPVDLAASDSMFPAPMSPTPLEVI